MFRRLVLCALIIVLVVPGVSVLAAPAPAGQAATGNISGLARSASGEPMPNTTVRLRNAQTGQLAGSTTTAADGGFSFTALPPGTYVVEVLNAVGEIVGASTTILLGATSMTATGVTVTAAGAQFLAAAGGGSFFTSTLGIVTIAAVGAGIAGVIVVKGRDDASPSR
jgi:hypothetical protein